MRFLVFCCCYCCLLLLFACWWLLFLFFFVCVCVCVCVVVCCWVFLGGMGGIKMSNAHTLQNTNMFRKVSSNLFNHNSA